MAVLIERQRRLIEVGIIRVGDSKPNDKQPGAFAAWNQEQAHRLTQDDEVSE